MQLSHDSAWAQDEVERFLATFEAPLRLAALDPDGYPRVCSLWYRAEGTRLHCATQREAWITRAFTTDPRCGFELGPNTPPYYGVRGRGRVEIASEGGAEELSGLLDRYLGGRDGELAKWLLARADREVVLSIDIDWITSWDYRARMGD